MKEIHPVCLQAKELRRASQLSLYEAEKKLGVNAIVLGSYERGDRQPTLLRMEKVLNGYGYTLVAVPKDFTAVRLPGDMAEELHAIADQVSRMEKRDQ